MKISARSCARTSRSRPGLVDEALVYADGKLTGLCRYDGTPLLDHAVAVAMVVISEVGLGRNSTVSAILHDVVRLAPSGSPRRVPRLTADIRDRFGEAGSWASRWASRTSRNCGSRSPREQADNFRDLLVSYSEGPRVILIKLADRLEVMRSLEMFPREKWRKKSWESMNLYAQIAHKLGALQPQERTGGHHTEIPRTRTTNISSPSSKRAPRSAGPSSRGSWCHRGEARQAGHQIPHQEPHQVDFLDLDEDAQAECPVRRGLRHLRHPHHHRLRQGAGEAAVLDGLFHRHGFYTPNPTAYATGSRSRNPTGTDRCTPPCRPAAGGSGADPHQTHGRRDRTRHRGALALGGSARRPRPAKWAGTPARTARGYHPFAGAALRRQAGLGRDLRLHAQRRPAESPRGFAPGLHVRHPRLAGLPRASAARVSTTGRSRSANSSTTATSSKS